MAERQGIMAGRAFVEFTLSDAALVKGLRNAQKRIEAFGNGLAGVGKKIAGVGTAVTVPLVLAAKSFASYGKQLAEVSARTNVAGSSLSELAYAAKETGSSLEDLESGLRTMQLRLLDARGGSEAVQKTLSELGLTVDGLSKLSPEKQFEAIAAALAKIKDPAKQAKLGIEMFGKVGASLKPLFAGGAAAIKALRDEAKRTGAAVSEEDIQAATELDDAFSRLTTSVNSVYVRLGAALAPALMTVLDIVEPIVLTASKWLRENKELVVSIAKFGVAAVVAGGAVYGLGTALGIVSTAIGGIAAVVGLLGGGPLAAAFWIALGGAVLYFGASFNSLDDVFSWARERFGTLAKEAGDLTTAFSNAFASGDTEAAAKLFWATLELIWENGKASLLSTTTELVFGMQEAFLNAETSMKSFWTGLQTEYEKTAAGFGELASALVGDFMAGDDADLKDAYRQGNEAMTDADRNRIKEQDARARAKINSEFAKEINLLDAARAEAAKSAQERLDDAKKAYELAKNTAIASKAPGPDVAAPNLRAPNLPDDNELRDVAEKAAASVSGSRAIFGGDLAGQIFGGDSFEKKNYEENKKAREAAERMDKRLQQIERNKFSLLMG
jgi:hypothetical protein